MAGASRKTDTTNTDAVDMEEMNPVWLKDKGMWVLLPFHPNISIVTYSPDCPLDISYELWMRICIKIQSFFNQWSFS